MHRIKVGIEIDSIYTVKTDKKVEVDNNAHRAGKVSKIHCYK